MTKPRADQVRDSITAAAQAATAVRVAARDAADKITAERAARAAQVIEPASHLRAMYSPLIR